MIGANNLAANPLLVNANADNYRLTPSSPCIRMGLPQAWMVGAFDLDGFPRTRMGAVDIGCYRFIPKATIITAY